MYKTKQSLLVGFCVFLAIFGVWSVSFAHQDNEENASSPAAWHEGYTLILMSNKDIASANRARDYVMSKGGRIAILSPPHVMLGWVSAELSAELIGKYGINVITQAPIDFSTLTHRDEQTLTITSFFNSVSSRSLTHEIVSSAAVKGEPLINDAFEQPPLNYGAYLKNLQHLGIALSPDLGIAPSPGNSDSMTGTVGVALFFVESDGTIDSNLYTWTPTDKQNTYNRALSGLSWWASQAPTYGTSVSFVVQDWDGPQGYEPVKHPTTDDSLWINAIMGKMGYGSNDKFANVTAFNTSLRSTLQTDWAYSVFIGYNPLDAPDRFTDGYFAYAYKGGPYVQMLFRNNGWGEENFGTILAHETGHIFWACDEYYQAGYGGCTSCGVCSASGPRPTILNGNCEYCNPNSVPCMMRFNSLALCEYTPQQIGWPSSPPPTKGLTVTPGDGLVSTGNPGGPFSPSSKVYTLQNTGGSSIDWTASVTQTWVSLSSTSGTLAAGAGTTVTVSINNNANSLAPGYFSDTVSFTNTTDGNGNTTIPMSLTVIAPSGDLSVTPLDGLNSSGNQGGSFNPSSMSYALRNMGNSSMNWAASVTQMWVSLSPTSGTLAVGASATVTVSINSNANSLGPGSYGDTVSLKNTTTGRGDTTRPVSLDVTALSRPDLIVSAVTAPSSVGPGQAIVVGDTTRNIGTVAVPASTTYFYLSSDTSLDATDIYLGSRNVRALTAGASDTGTISVTLPGSMRAGTWYIIAKADGPGTISEISETNNTNYKGFAVVAPDLIISTLTGPTTVAPGQVISFSEATRNQGRAATTVNTVTRFYWSTDSTLDASDVRIGERTVGPLATGATSGPVNTSVTIPSTALPGTYYIIAKADADNVVAETSETNNTYSRGIVVVAPDLIISTLTGPTTVAPGQVIKLSEATRNQGRAATTVNTVTRFYWSTDSTLDGSDEPIGQRTVGPLTAGATSGPVNTSVTIPSTALPGTYYIIAKADADNVVAGTSETNNTYSRGIVVVGPDLTVSAVTAPSSAGLGQAIMIGDTTRNIGAAAAPASKTYYYLSNDTNLDAADTYLGSRDVPALAAGLSNTGTISVTLPGSMATGTWYIIAKADGAGTVSEASETNNTYYTGFVVVAPDLIISTLTGPTTVAPGQVIKLSEATRNQGRAATTVNTVTRFYWSTDSSYHASDMPIGQRTVGPLAAGATSGPVNTSVTIPSTVLPGTYYIIAKVDADNAVAEVSDVNNTRSLRLTILP